MSTDPAPPPEAPVPPPRRADAPHLGRAPAGIAFRAIQGALIGGFLAFGVGFVVACVTRSFLTAAMLGAAAAAMLGRYERRSGDAALGAGLLGFAAALVAAVALGAARKALRL